MNNPVVNPATVAKQMVEKNNFELTKDNLELDMTNFSNALLDSLDQLYNLESMVYTSLETMLKRKEDENRRRDSEEAE